jgi:hypothetical protein
VEACEDPYLRFAPCCRPLRFGPDEYRIYCACGAIWGPQDWYGGRTRINEDGTPWTREPAV